jgi:hypothetical protein
MNRVLACRSVYDFFVDHNIELSSRAESEMQLLFMRSEPLLAVIGPADCSNDWLYST